MAEGAWLAGKSRFDAAPEPVVVTGGGLVLEPADVAVGEGIVGAAHMALRRALLVLQAAGAGRDDAEHVVPRRDAVERPAARPVVEVRQAPEFDDENGIGW